MGAVAFLGGSGFWLSVAGAGASVLELPGAGGACEGPELFLDGSG